MEQVIAKGMAVLCYERSYVLMTLNYCKSTGYGMPYAEWMSGIVRIERLIDVFIELISVQLCRYVFGLLSSNFNGKQVIM